jgi:hypothetical protein
LEQKDCTFKKDSTRYPLQFQWATLKKRGPLEFPLLSGLKRKFLLFYHDSKKEKSVQIERCLEQKKKTF